MADSRAAWSGLPPDELAPCDAPRHEEESAFPLASWRLALVHPDAAPEFHSLCSDCMEAIAADLGTTAEEGRARL